MPDTRFPGSISSSNPWPLVLCLVGVDYFSTLAYLPSIAVCAAGPWAPIAAGGVVLVTFLLALPLYWYVVGRSPDGRGATGLLEDLIPGWRGKLVVLTLLGFAAADFVITRSLSVAVAAVHLIHNPHGQRLLQRLPAGLFIDEHVLWPPAGVRTEAPYRTPGCDHPGPVDHVVRRLAIAQTWRHTGDFAHHRGRSVLLSGSIDGGDLQRDSPMSRSIPRSGRSGCIPFSCCNRPTAPPPHHTGYTWPWAWLSIALWSFPQMALGLSGFEMILTVVPQVSGGMGQKDDSTAGRVRNTRKLMLTAATIMAIYLLSAVLVTTLFVPRAELGTDGTAEHRALAYLAHGSPLVDGAGGATLNPFFGHRFGDLFDLSTSIILCLAGASVTLGLQNMLPHYLNRLGMDMSWAGRFGIILLVLNVTILVVTVVFQASPSSQQWAYATSVLVLLSGAALAAAKDLGQFATRGFQHVLRLARFVVAGAFFLVMTGLTVLINQSGLTIAMSFVLAILISSIISRWIRSTELRFEGFEFTDEAARNRWETLCHSGAKVLVPHRPGLISLAEKSRELQRDYRLDPATPVIFIEAFLGDPSNFSQKPLMKIEGEAGLEVIRVSRCVSISHVLAAICLELCRDGGDPPEIIFGWSNEPPLAANLNFLLLGEGNIPWMVKELVRKAMPSTARQPRILIG